MTQRTTCLDEPPTNNRRGLDRGALDGELVVVWRVTTTCTLGCHFCGYSQQLRWPRSTAKVESIYKFGQVLADYQRESGRSVHVSWLGGEPLDWSKLSDIARRFHEQFQLRLGVTTNGLPLASRRIRADLLAYYEQVTISIDGLATTHDRVRGRTGLFAAIRDNVAELHRENRSGRLLLRVNIVLMRDNIAEFAAFCQEMAAWGFQEVTFNPLGGNDRPEFFPGHRLLPEQVQRFRQELPEMIAQGAKLGLAIRGSERYLDRIARTANGQKIAIADCQPGSRFLFIDESGRASPCSFTCRDYGVELSSIHSTQMLRDLPRHFAQQRRERPHSCCDDCHATFVFDKFGVFQNASRLPIHGGA